MVIPELVARAVDVFGPIDILVNNAGINWASPAENPPLDQWLRVMDVNLNALASGWGCHGINVNALCPGFL